MSEKNEDDEKSLLKVQNEISQNVRLWYVDNYKITPADTISSKFYKIGMRILITLIMIVLSPVLLAILLIIFVGTG